MKKALKWIGIILGGLVILLIVALVGLSLAGNAKVKQKREVQAEVINILTDEAALARGRHLVHASCESCHGADLSGQVMMDDPAIATLYASNITGLAQTHSDGEIILAIRHGIDTDGRQLMIMPSESFVYFSEEDLGAIVGYLKTVPRVGDNLPLIQPGPVGRILMGAGAFDSSFPANHIDHNLPFPAMPEVGANLAYGEYVSRFCRACHGADLTGGQPPDPASPPAPNITATGGVGAWTEAQFIEFFHTGVNPFGEESDPAFMPWQSFGKFEDDELRALYMYLSSQ